HKSPDPDVRVASVQELTTSDEDAAVLVALAREDVDARVRRAAADRVTDVGVLAAIARGDQDEGIREEVARRLADLAMSDSAEAGPALATLTDPKQIASVAKNSPVD